MSSHNRTIKITCNYIWNRCNLSSNKWRSSVKYDIKILINKQKFSKVFMCNDKPWYWLAINIIFIEFSRKNVFIFNSKMLAYACLCFLYWPYWNRGRWLKMTLLKCFIWIQPWKKNNIYSIAGLPNVKINVFLKWLIIMSPEKPQISFCLAAHTVRMPS